eukprot:gene3682-4237_t
MTDEDLEQIYKMKIAIDLENVNKETHDIICKTTDEHTKIFDRKDERVILLKYYGESTFNQLGSRIATRSKPAILLAGHQLTGKSTMAKKLSNYYEGGSFYSVGSMFRELAASLNISVPEQSRILKEIQERVDVELDFKTCTLIQGIDLPMAPNSSTTSSEATSTITESKYIVMEGRQPAILGNCL